MEKTEKKLTKRDFFIPENLKKEETKVHQSPSGKYSITIEIYNTIGNGWQYSKGIIKKGDQVIHEVYRNYSSFWFCWLEKHPSGKPFILYGENYMGYSSFNMEDGVEQIQHPTKTEKGYSTGWCIAEMQSNPSNDKVAALGCFWAGPYSLKFFEAEDLSTLPLKLIREDDKAHYAEKIEWADDTSVTCTVSDDYCNYHKKTWEDMLGTELDYSDKLELAIEEKFPGYPEYFTRKSQFDLNIFNEEVSNKKIVDNSNIEVDNFVKTL